MISSEIYLREKGIKPSYQRKRIYEYLMDNNNHPTVNDIYNDLIKDIPVLSKATVYNTMKLFKEHNLIEIIPIEGHESRFDIHSDELHAHFKCEKCGRVYDASIDVPLETLSKNLDGYKITGQNFNFTGVCKDCLDNRE